MSYDFDLPTVAPEPPEPEPPTSRGSKKGWFVVVAAVLVGALLVGGAFLFRTQQVDDRSDARKARDVAALRVRAAQQKLDQATAAYNEANNDLAQARAAAKVEIPAANDLVVKADAATRALNDHAATLHGVAQAWLDQRVSDYNRRVGELNAHLQAVRDAGSALAAAELAFAIATAQAGPGASTA
jgi:hypothetical protein